MIPFIWPFRESEATMVNRSGPEKLGEENCLQRGMQELSDLMERLGMILVIVT